MVAQFFKIQFTNTLNLPWEFTQIFIVNGSSENPVNSIVVKKIIQTETKHDEFGEILLNFDFRVRGKVPF